MSPLFAAALCAALLVVVPPPAARAQTARAATGAFTPTTGSSLSMTSREINWTKYAFNARFNAVSSDCGQSIVTSWVVILEQYWSRTGGNTAAAFTTTATDTGTGGVAFNTGTGTWTCPIDGVYYISTFGRCQNSGHCDLTIRIGNNANNRIAGWGTDIPARNSNMWLSSGVATIERLFGGETLTVYHESGSTTGDCIWQPGPNTQNSDYDYNQFSIFLLFADELNSGAIAAGNG